jgi:hypothetical protein
VLACVSVRALLMGPTKQFAVPLRHGIYRDASSSAKEYGRRLGKRKEAASSCFAFHRPGSSGQCAAVQSLFFFFAALLWAAAGLGPTSTRKEETEAKVEKSDGA